MKKRKKHKSSILQQKGEPCYLCMKLKPMREWRRAVHNNAEMMRLLREDGQRAFEQKYTREEFMKMFGKNYLEE